MKPSKIRALVVGLSVAMAFAWSAGAQTPPGQDVPTDLVPLLAKPQSEMRIVVQRYATDRTTLAGNYVGGGGGGRGGGRGGRAGGTGAAAAPDSAPGAAAAPVALSTARIARLKRFDLEWQTALARIDGSRLSSAARVGSRQPEIDRPDQPHAARDRDGGDRAGDAARALWRRARATARVTHASRGRAAAEGGRGADAGHERDRTDADASRGRTRQRIGAQSVARRS